jgi:hypothetical protein
MSGAVVDVIVYTVGVLLGLAGISDTVAIGVGLGGVGDGRAIVYSAPPCIESCPGSPV